MNPLAKVIEDIHRRLPSNDDIAPFTAIKNCKKNWVTMIYVPMVLGVPFKRCLTEPPSLFDAKLKKGDLIGALDQSILKADKAQEIARKGITNLKHKSKRIKALTEKTLDKYHLL